MHKKLPPRRPGREFRIEFTIYLSLRQLHPQTVDHVGTGTGALGGIGQAIREAVVRRPIDSGLGPTAAAGVGASSPG